MSIWKLSAEDRLDILELYALYAHAEDAGDNMGFLACWDEDGVLEGPRGHFEGHNGLSEFFDALMPTNKGKRHVTVNHLIHATEKGAEVASNFLLIDVAETTRLVGSGSYRDSLRHSGGTWRISKRVVSLDARTAGAKIP
jgi:hypothetical protein